MKELSPNNSATPGITFRHILNNEVVESIFENHPDGVFCFDSQGVIVSVNSASCKISGYSRQELVGKSFVRFIERFQIPAARRSVEGVSRGRYVHFDTTLVHKNGQHVHLSVTAIPITVKGHFEGFYGIARDITERKKLSNMLKEVRDEYEDLFQNAPMGLFSEAFVNGEYVVMRMNKKASEIYGYTQQEVENLQVRELVAERSRELFEQSLTDIQKGRHITYECFNRRKDGSEFPVRVSINVSQSDECSTIVAVEDISLRKSLEESLQQSNTSLERTNKLQDLVLRMLSHDFRSPFNSIMGGAKLLMECDLSDEQRELVDIIYRGAKHELSMIDNLLRFTQIEGGKIKFNQESISSHVIAHELRKQHREQADRKKIRLKFGRIDPIHFYVDFSALQRNILDNIISNAIKYSYPGGEVRIDIVAASDKLGVVRIQDSGVGIPEELLPNIFDINPAKRRIGTNKEKSTGFGLYISSQMTKMMGGEIEMASREEQGTIVKITLPLVQNATKGDTRPVGDAVMYPAPRHILH